MHNLSATSIVPLSFLLLVLGTSACQPVESMNCDSISEAVFSTFPSTETDPTVLQKWISTHYTAAGASLKQTSDVSGAIWFYWSTEEKVYNAAVDSSGAWLYYDWKSRKPNLKDVIGCLGTPMFYEARDVSGQYAAVLFGIWYPAHNLYLSTVLPGSRLVVNDGTTFSTLVVPSPDSMHLRKLKPWPNNINDLSLDP